MSSAHTTVPVLSSEPNWKPWYGYFVSVAEKHEVDVYLNLDDPDAPRKPTAPIEPTISDVAADIVLQLPSTTPSSSSTNSSYTQTTRPPKYSDLTADERDEYRRLQARYDKDEKEYKKKMQALRDLKLEVHRTVDVKHHNAYLNPKYDLYTILTKLRDRFKPTDFAETKRLRDTWESLCRTTRVMNHDAWVQQVRMCYDECMEANLPIVQGTWPVESIMVALNNIAPEFATAFSYERSKGVQIDFLPLLEQYHRWARDQQALRPKGSARNTVYSTETAIPESTLPTPKPTPTLNGKDNNGGPKPCLCGEHLGWSKCPYLWEWLRPEGWKPDERVVKLIEEKKKTKRVAISLAKLEEKLKSKRHQDSSETSVEREIPSSYTVSTSTPLSYAVDRNLTGIHLPLLNSYILDSAATQSVCNDRSRFIEFTPTLADDDMLIAGSNVVRIEGKGKIAVKVEGDKTKACPSGIRELVLNDVAYIPSFTTNIVSYYTLHTKGLFWDPKTERLAFKGLTISKTLRRHGQWVLEYHQISTTTVYPAVSSRAALRKATWSMKEAHEKMGHTYAEALSHLPQASFDIEAIQGKLDQCETCQIHDAKRQISRRVPARAERPFYRLCVDFIPMRDGYIAHIYDDFLGYHWVRHIPTTTARHLIQPIKFAVNQSKRRWNFEVIVIRIDNQMSLIDSSEWEDYIAETGLHIELSAPNAHEQNGAAEVSGGVLTRRSAKLKTSANLPESLYPECYRTAAYIQNRAPSRRLGWKSPLGYLQELIGTTVPQPKVAHMKAYGCKAYALNHHIDKLDRLEPRVHIGYLVGYQSTNIFRVWVPTLSRVISVRDVTFDESQRYSHQDILEDVVIEKVVRPIELIVKEDDDIATYHYERSIDAPNDTIVVDTRDESATTQSATEATTTQLISTNQSTTDQLPTPETTPQPETTPSTRSNTSGLDEGAVIDWERRSIRRRDVREAHTNTMSHLHYHSAYHNEFAYGIQHDRPRIHRSELQKEPNTWNEMLRHKYREEWLKAVEVEYQELLRTHTFEIRSESEADSFVIPTRFVFTYKLDEDGFLAKFKARLVVRGDLQPWTGEDTYASTLAARVFRFLMAITAYFGLETRQFDAVNAFLNAKMRKPAWIRLPNGYNLPGKILLLLKALYGLRISPLLWYDHLHDLMKDLGLKPIAECACLFANDKLIVFFYVDDIVVLFHHSDQAFYDEFEAKLMSKLKLRPMGELSWFLGIRVLRNRAQHKLWLCQDSYLDKKAHEFGVTEYGSSKVPLSPTLAVELVKFDGTPTPEEIKLYQGKIGSIGYPTSITRPDCALTLHKLSQFLQNPGPIHQKAANSCLAYLYQTRYLALEYGSDRAFLPTSPYFLAASDASFGDDPIRRWSTEGTLFQLFGGTIDWSSSFQHTVTTSSTEAELLALSHICAWLFWWRRVFNSIDLDLDCDTTVNCDNLQTVRLAMKDAPKLITKLKHVDIKGHWLRQETEKGTLRVDWISTNEMPADGLTKPLGPQKHRAFVEQLRMVDIKELIAEIDNK